jgi:hypothetical protein
MQTLYQSLLVLHIASFIAATGAVIITFVSYNQFWRLHAANKEQGIAAFSSFQKTQTVGLLGLLIAVLAGITMELVVKGAHTELLWFKVKMFFVILLFVNGFTIGRTSAIRLQKLIAGEDEILSSKSAIEKLKRNFRIFQCTQLLIYLVIIIMVAFRFS